MSKAKIRLLSALTYPIRRYDEDVDKHWVQLHNDDALKGRAEYASKPYMANTARGPLREVQEGAVRDAAMALADARDRYEQTVIAVTELSSEPLSSRRVAELAGVTHPVISKLTKNDSAVDAAIRTILSEFGEEMMVMGISEQSDIQTIRMALGLLLSMGSDDRESEENNG